MEENLRLRQIRKNPRKRSSSPDHYRRRSPSPERRRSRSRSADRTHRRSSHNRRSPSYDANRRKRRREGSDDDRQLRRSKGSEENAANGAAKKVDASVAGNVAAETVELTEVDNEEMEMMKMMGIPVGFDTTKGKHVDGADVSGVRMVTKRQPRQYMNRRGGFNRPLPPERNR
ncbi:hypothetical protein KSP40_PGU005637 [Platanthera guangdongensis]|uniref:U4/U6.U5 small nuclear ribonucleoprotein 27kDa protein domain-containing protein n=1 Tax=Platanthera guangdongensis TaxID=2320717 RepID=A0ABR2MUB0_9ASPA